MPTSTPRLSDLRQLMERNERVFPTHPLVARYFPSASIEDARQRLTRAIERGEGPGMIVGGAGTGKSLLLQVLAAQFHDRVDVVLLACARICTRRALLQAILFELGLPYRLRDEGDLRLGLLDHLLTVEKCPEGLLLLVDEAQALPPALLDELRVMTNLVRGGVPRVRLILAGSAALEEAFASLELESFSQRLSARCYLAPLSRDETSQFIRAQVAASGGAPDELFARDACAAVFDATDGVPRLVNQLCDRALWLAVSKEQLRVERDLIQTAWADLQQLPAPWDNSSTTICPTAPADIVEFGGLQADDSMVSILDLTSEPSSEIEAPLRESDDRPTELIAPAKETAPTIIPTPIKVSTPPPADPFAEKFDEEEVVIDSFAAWDDMFRREAPRVENCRDPEFASLVQAAIDNSPIAHACMSPRASVEPDELTYGQALDPQQRSEFFAFEDKTSEEQSNEVSPYDDEFESTHEEWQPLRLAVLSDPVPLRPIPLVAPASRPGPLSRDATPTDSVDESDDWPELAEYSSPAAVFSESFGKPAQGRGARDNDPILVIEEDAPATTLSDSQVRHEDYRHLFSRLHSG
jgi:type II secretory pathway predicted ATPase ExeA